MSVIVKKGLPIRLEVEEEMHEISDGKMNRIIKEKDYQTVNLIKRNGVISLIRRKETIPLNN